MSYVNDLITNESTFGSLKMVLSMFANSNKVKQEELNQDSSMPFDNIKNDLNTGSLLPNLMPVKMYPSQSIKYYINNSNQRTKAAFCVYGQESLLRSRSVSTKVNQNKSLNYIKRMKELVYPNKVNLTVINEQKQNIRKNSKNHFPNNISNFSQYKMQSQIATYKHKANPKIGNISVQTYSTQFPHTRTSLRHDIYIKKN